MTMRPERLRSIIRAALDEGAVQVEIELTTGEKVKVAFAAEKVKPEELPVEWKR